MLAPFEQTETLFRMYGDELSSEDRWAIQEFLFLCECEDYLLSQGMPGQPALFRSRSAGDTTRSKGLKLPEH